MEEIATNDYNLNISRYISTVRPKEQIGLQAINAGLVDLEKKIIKATKKHNEFLKELGLPPLPLTSQKKDTDVRNNDFK